MLFKVPSFQGSITFPSGEKIMFKRLTLFVALLAAGSLLMACSGSSNNASGSLKDPKSSLAYQFELVKAGDVDKLKACLTPRVRDSVTQEVMDKAKVEAAKYTLDDLYASAEMGEADGKKTAKVKMKNGRTLTTLIETDGQWLADTIWFK
jgi:hypothetical protein